MVWVLVAVLVIALVVAGVVISRQRKSQQLQKGFGPEYERTVEQTGDRGAAESELREREKRREEFDIRELDEGARERYAERWQGVQREFVDEPSGAVGNAHRLVTEVMRERGYPVDDDFDRRAADLSVDHPVVVDNYRSGHEISQRAERGDAGTEDLRQALVHYRELFDELLGRGTTHDTGTDEKELQR
jgi:hypothetical protein